MKFINFFLLLLLVEEMYIFMFYGSGDNSLLLEASFENDNFYDDYEFTWSCLPVDEGSCPYCPSEGFFFLFFLFFFLSPHQFRFFRKY